MEAPNHIAPLSQKTRQRTFAFLLLVFCIAIPLLYMYATGYRLDFRKPTNFVSTGGISVTVPVTEAEIYIDDELVRATRTFRRALYAQGIDVGTHRIYVQKDGYHTWVKELPVSEHLVTETESFNLPVVPQVRVISKMVSATGTPIVAAPILNASTTNEVFATTTKSSKLFVINSEFESLVGKFATTSTTTKKETPAQQLKDLLNKNNATSTVVGETATSTVVRDGVKLYESGDDVYATWIGSFEQMPYYYCAPDFPRYSSSTATTVPDVQIPEPEIEKVPDEIPEDGQLVIHPVQTIPKDTACDPTIRIDRKWQNVRDFDFYPDDGDLVLMVLDNGIYVVEIDDRSWQNVQPLMLGNNLNLYIDNRNIYVYDGTLIYQVMPTIE